MLVPDTEKHCPMCGSPLLANPYQSSNTEDTMVSESGEENTSVIGGYDSEEEPTIVGQYGMGQQMQLAGMGMAGTVQQPKKRNTLLMVLIPVLSFLVAGVFTWGYLINTRNREDRIEAEKLAKQSVGAKLSEFATLDSIGWTLVTAKGVAGPDTTFLYAITPRGILMSTNVMRLDNDRWLHLNLEDVHVSQPLPPTAFMDDAILTGQQTRTVTEIQKAADDNFKNKKDLLASVVRAYGSQYGQVISSPIRQSYGNYTPKGCYASVTDAKKGKVALAVKGSSTDDYYVYTFTANYAVTCKRTDNGLEVDKVTFTKFTNQKSTLTDYGRLRMYGYDDYYYD